MITGILLYFAVSFLASLVIYGACLAAARADLAFDKKKQKLPKQTQPEQPLEMEQPQE